VNGKCISIHEKKAGYFQPLRKKPQKLFSWNIIMLLLDRNEIIPGLLWFVSWSVSPVPVVICDLLWQKEALGVRSWKWAVGVGWFCTKLSLKWCMIHDNLLTIDWDMDFRIRIQSSFSHVFGYNNYFEKTSSKGKLGAYFKYEKH
jgi:hypothetical protein